VHCNIAIPTDMQIVHKNKAAQMFPLCTIKCTVYSRIVLSLEDENRTKNVHRHKKVKKEFEEKTQN
jgi:hypothetical protein